ncbi:MAG TPA: hypothetical protein DHV96_06385 [Lachnospiraceae bacterium]|nr:hypothetical protein [Lachnospiraceae bacterium]
MSQEKVDKRKYEKQHRKEIERKRKIRLTVKCIIVALIIGAAVGVPTGIKIYKNQPKFVGDSTVEAYIGNYIDENYASEISGLGITEATTESETTEDEVTKAVEDAVGSDVETVNEDNVDEVLGTDTEESSSETEE